MFIKFFSEMAHCMYTVDLDKTFRLKHFQMWCTRHVTQATDIRARSDICSI